MKKKTIPVKKKVRKLAAPGQRARPCQIKKSVAAKPEPWLLRLYVAGQTPNSIIAFTNLKQICDEHLTDSYRIEVIDLTTAPQRAVDDQIVALPTLIRKIPEPVKRVIGSLSNVERVLVGIEVPVRQRTKA